MTTKKEIKTVEGTVKDKLIINGKEYKYNLEWDNLKIMSEILDKIDYKLEAQQNPDINALAIDFFNYVSKKYYKAHELFTKFLMDVYNLNEEEFKELKFAGPLKLIKHLFKDKDFIDFFSSLLK